MKRRTYTLRWFIRQKLEVHNLTRNKTDGARIASQESIHGDEANIVLISLCVNNPEYPLGVHFTADPYGPNFLASQAKH